MIEALDVMEIGNVDGGATGIGEAIVVALVAEAVVSFVEGFMAAIAD